MLAKVTDALGISMEKFFHYIQPLSVEGEGTPLGQIVDRLRGRSVEEQRKILKLIDLFLEDL
ncbi:hypothetical protein [Paenibacillus sp. N3.4]|uniref:hypothetical protein n=1 Tax=Paenibacillus sp. N3.4 TaxID=2603222 RepID=UPI001C9C0A83|nr:hypothetical protein [Paenibacillus sp. N3.4]